MVREAETKIYKTNGRHYLYLPKALITDSNFPLDIKKPILIRIEGNKLTIENKAK